jgi:DNA polymerase-1
MLALIDADSLLYKVGFAIEEKTYWNEFDVEAGLEDSSDITLDTDMEQCFRTFDQLIDNIMFATECDDLLLVFSGKDNFRLSLPTSYKENRVGLRKPTGYEEILRYAQAGYNTYTPFGIEADDYVVWYKTTSDEDVVLCAYDKDVLYQTVGTHYNYGKDKWIEVDEWEAIKFAYYQTLTGDQSDGYKGCKGIGAVRAEAALADCTTEEELWKVVVDLYEAKGHDPEEALWTMRLANMHQFDGEKINLWNPPS